MKKVKAEPIQVNESKERLQKLSPTGDKLGSISVRYTNWKIPSIKDSQRKLINSGKFAGEDIKAEHSTNLAHVETYIVNNEYLKLFFTEKIDFAACTFEDKLIAITFDPKPSDGNGEVNTNMGMIVITFERNFRRSIRISINGNVIINVTDPTNKTDYSKQ